MPSTRLFPSSPRRLGSLRHSRQGCLRYHDNPVTNNLWMHRAPRAGPVGAPMNTARISFLSSIRNRGESSGEEASPRRRSQTAFARQLRRNQTDEEKELGHAEKKNG